MLNRLFFSGFNLGLFSLGIHDVGQLETVVVALVEALEIEGEEQGKDAETKIIMGMV